MPDIISHSEEVNLFGDVTQLKSKADREQLASMLYQQMKDITVEEFAGMLTNRFQAVMDYVDLCANNKKTGQRISLLFNPHRLDTGTKRFPISLYKALKNEKFMLGLARVIFLNQTKGNSSDLLYASIGVGVEGTSYLNEFPPHVARDLALEYNLTLNSKVLDPCAGWGGRMLGFSAVVNSYTCCEPSVRTAAGLRKLLTFIHNFRSDFSATIHEAPFEDVELSRATYDFAMTSPPYFDTEHYAPGEAANSFNRYATFESWVAGFYGPLIHRTMAALKPGAVFVINIGSRLYPLNDKLYEVAKGKYAVEKQKGRLSASNGLGKEGEGETFYEVKNPGEYVVIDEVALVAELAHVEQPVAVSEPVSQPATLSLTSAFDFATSQPDASSDTSEAQTVTQAAVPARVATAEFTALDFVLKTTEDVPEAEPSLESQSSSQPSEPSAPPQSLLSAIDFATDPDEPLYKLFADSLRERGHHLFDRRGKLLVTNPDTLTEDDTLTIEQIEDKLLTYADPYVEVRSAQSLADFLRNEPAEADWRAQEPPSLDGIKDIVLNFETNGLEWWAGAEPIGVTVGSLDGKLKRFLPFAFQGGGNLDKAAVKYFLEQEVRDKNITNANMRFDVHMSRVMGVDLEKQGNTVSDVMHYAALLDDHRRRFALDVLATDYLGGIAVERVDERSMEHYAAHEVAARAEYQVELVAQLREKMWPLLDAQDLQRVRQLEDDVIYAVVECEKNAAPIDVELLHKDKAEIERRHAELILEISREVGFAFDNTSSSWQRVFEKYGYDVSHLDTGRATFAENIIGEIDHPVIKKAHYAGQLASLNSKIYLPYSKQVGSDGLLHFDLNQLRGEEGGTVSGRFSAPYIQQVPNHDNHAAVFGEEFFPRRLYVPASGHYFEGDAAQIEFRIFAHHANNAAILAAYAENPEVSFHRLIHKMLLPYKADMSYTALKSLNFATIYSAGLIKTAVMMGFISAEVGEQIREAKTQTTDIRLVQAREIKAIYNKLLPEIDPLLKYASHVAQTECDNWCRRSEISRKLHDVDKRPHKGFVQTLLGRRSRFPNNYSLHKALNRVIQGSAADIMKQKLVELHREREYTGFTLRMTVHDSVLGDVPDQESAARVKEVLNRQTTKLKVPILWETGMGRNWAETK